jgi:hypothetical protein
MISLQALTALVLSAMLHMSPSGRYPYEDTAVREARFGEIAQDFAQVALNEDEAPLFPGEYGRAHTALFEASVAFNESGFREEVDLGKVRGDKGKSICIMQIQLGQPKPFDYSEEWLLEDRKNCLSAGLEMIRTHRCSTNNLRTMMRSYVSGDCNTRTDPNEEMVVARTALNEVVGYVNFMKHLRKENFKFISLVEPEEQEETSTNNKSTPVTSPFFSSVVVKNSSE